ncbi:MAG: hypothetical protein V4659_06860 [Pseudomonadota bacterium]
MAGVSPLWLAQPSRFAALSRTRARIGLVLLALLVALCLTALATPAPPAATGAGRAEDQADVVLYEGIVEGVRHGGRYYEVAAQALRAGDYPLRPFVTFRLPTLAVIQGAVPALVTIGLLYVLAFAVLLAWAIRLVPALNRRPPVIVALALLAGGMVAFVQSELAAFHEIWAGLFIALSLALRRPGRWVEAVALGLVAMLIRETAALYVAVMCLAAWLEGQRREAIGWAASVAVLAVVVMLHAQAVAEVVRPLDPASPGWAGMLGFGFFVTTLSVSTALMLAPLWLAAILVALSFAGWAAWRDPLATRALAMFVSYGALLALFGRPDTFYWGLMIAPTFLIGLAFAPDALRDLIGRARDRRRITVTRSAA